MNNGRPPGTRGSMMDRLRRAQSRGISALLTGENAAYLLVAVSAVLMIVIFGFNTAADAGRWVLLALGLNIVVGYAGLLDLGYAAFFAIGSYSFAMLASSQFNIHLSFWLLLFLSALIAAFFGVILGAPTLRLRGDYLAIVTLGFGEIVPRVFRNASTYTGGVNGIVGLDQPSIPKVFGFGGYSFSFDPLPYLILIVVVILLSIYLINNLRNSRLGRAWMAIREDEVAAAASGVNTVTTKLLAFALGASFSGFAGTYYASKLFLVTPESFGFVVSVTVLVMVVLGGMGNIPGVIFGALLIYILQYQILIQLPGWITTLASSLNLGFLNNIDLGGIVQRSNYLIFGMILVIIMLLRPQGLIPSAQRKVELEMGTQEESVSDMRGTA